MGKGGGGQPTTQTVNQTNLPEYAKPYFENIMERAQAESYRPYTPYEGDRIAGFTPTQTQLQSQTLGMTTPSQLGSGTNFATSGGQQSGLYGAQGAGAGQQAMQYGAQGAQTGQQGQLYGGLGAGYGALAAGAGQQYANMATNPAATQAYMSPYMQNVVDVQKQQAIRDAQQSNVGANLASVRQGTYGGARQLLAQEERNRNLQQGLANIQATGSQRAFEQAQQAQQYGAGLGLQGLQAGMQGAQVGLQGLEAAQRAAQLGIQGTQAGMQGAQVGLQGAQQLTQAGATLADIGKAQQATDLQRLQAQQGVAGQQQAMSQQQLDMAYADFLRQRDYPMEQLGYFSNLMRGIPVGLGSTSTTYAPPPSSAAQLMGLGTGAYAMGKLAGMAAGGSVPSGLAALGLYNMDRG